MGFAYYRDKTLSVLEEIWEVLSGGFLLMLFVVYVFIVGMLQLAWWLFMIGACVAVVLWVARLFHAY